jgi:mono/diheme cytochrome c family protein
VVAATWLDEAAAEEVLAVVEPAESDPFERTVLLNAQAQAKGQAYVEPVSSIAEDPDSPIARAYAMGEEIYSREAYCETCHQKDGKGLAATGYPPLAGSPWVTGNPDRLIKLVMYGLYGPMEVLGKKYDGQVPMTAYGGLMTNEEMAAVLTYVRNSFGNEAGMIKPEQVDAIRTSTAGRKGMYKAEELLKEHPLEVKK